MVWGQVFLLDKANLLEATFAMVNINFIASLFPKARCQEKMLPLGD